MKTWQKLASLAKKMGITQQRKYSNTLFSVY